MTASLKYIYHNNNNSSENNYLTLIFNQTTYNIDAIYPGLSESSCKLAHNRLIYIIHSISNIDEGSSSNHPVKFWSEHKTELYIKQIYFIAGLTKPATNLINYHTIKYDADLFIKILKQKAPKSYKSLQYFDSKLIYLSLLTNLWYTLLIQNTQDSNLTTVLRRPKV